MVDAEVARRAAQPQTPAEFALKASRGRWKMARHLELVNKKLTDLSNGTIKRLILTFPPRHSKSETGSKFFPAWFIGRNPDKRVILASYEANFAASWGEKARDLIVEYGPSMFGIKINPNSAARDDWKIDGRDGGMVTAGVGGSITGRGADLCIVDDFIKNSQEASSKTIRDRTWDWWQSTMLTRLEPDGVVLIIATRWHQDDLIGRLLKEQNDPDEPDNEKWELLNLPALAEDNDALGRKPGEALWPWRFDEKKLNARRRRMNPYLWNALYQQRPMPPGGEIFKRDSFREYETLSIDGKVQFYKLFNAAGNSWLVKASDCIVFLSVDPASSEKDSADPTVVEAWVLTPSYDMLLVDMSRQRARISKSRETIVTMYRKWNCEFCAVEKNTVGLPLLQSLRDGGLAVKAIESRVDKVLRAQAAEMRFGAGMIHFPKNCMFSTEMRMLIEELESFPKGVNDDCVDSLCQAADIVNRLGGSVRDREDVEYADKVIAEESAAEQRAIAPGGKVEQLQLAGPEDPDELWLES